MTQRVIKFRYLWKHDGTGKIVSKEYELSDIQNWLVEYPDHTIRWDIIARLQFTGLHDKNGKEIYEGDIYEYEAWHGGIEHAMLEKSLKEQGKPLPSYKERRVILSHPYGHFITRKLDDITDMTYSGDTFHHSPAITATWEVIGNIYTTPELVDPKMIEHGNS